MVGVVRFELTTSSSRTTRATRLRYTPTQKFRSHLESERAGIKAYRVLNATRFFGELKVTTKSGNNRTNN